MVRSQLPRSSRKASSKATPQSPHLLVIQYSLDKYYDLYTIAKASSSIPVLNVWSPANSFIYLKQRIPAADASNTLHLLQEAIFFASPCPGYLTHMQVPETYMSATPVIRYASWPPLPLSRISRGLQVRGPGPNYTITFRQTRLTQRLELVPQGVLSDAETRRASGVCGIVG